MKEQNIIEPNYYKMQVGDVFIDVFDIADAFNLTHREFNAIKYILRRKDNRVHDIQKAIKCLERELEFLVKV